MDCFVSRNMETQVVSVLMCVINRMRETVEGGHRHMCSDIYSAMKGS